MLFLAPLNTSHSTHASPRTSPLFPSLCLTVTAVSDALGELRPFTIPISSGTHPLCLVTPAITSAKIPIPHPVIHSQGEISMVNNAQGHIARTRPIDHATADYDLELNRSRHTRTPATVAASAAKPLPTPPASPAETTRAMVPHYGKPPCIPSYRDNHAPRRAIFDTPCHNTLRGPPGSSRRPPGAQRDASGATWTRRYRRPADALSMHCSGDGSLGSRRNRTEEKGLGG